MEKQYKPISNDVIDGLLLLSSNNNNEKNLKRSIENVEEDDENNNNNKRQKIEEDNNNNSVEETVILSSENTILPDQKINLSDEQLNILQTAKSGKSFFFTGAAGTGKSLLLQEIIREMKQIYKPETIHVTATTGRAACNIGGSTIHYFAGIGIGSHPFPTLISIIKRNSFVKKRWENAKIIIIDEISMLNAKFFDTLNQIAKTIRQNKSFFGGIQMILCGDFLQLPPVDKDNNNNTDNYPSFCFETESWKELDLCFELNHVFRQKDQKLVDILNEIRLGYISDESLKLLQSTSTNKLNDNTNIIPTKLYALKKFVNDENLKHLNDIKNEELIIYTSVDTYCEKRKIQIQQEENIIAPKELHLKKGAQVILLKNISFEKGLVNGARGVVIGFKKQVESDPKSYPIIEFTSGLQVTILPEEFTIESAGQIIFRRKQIPLDLAWAITIHKSQGMTIPKLVIDFKNIFEFGMVYTALSRATCFDGIEIHRLDPMCIKSHPKAIEFYNQLHEKQK